MNVHYHYIHEAEGFEWDKGNINKNWKKHHVSAQEAEEVFKNEPKIILYDAKHSQTEERFSILGQTNKGRFLTIIFTMRENKIRIISARDQHKIEKRAYEKAI